MGLLWRGKATATLSPRPSGMRGFIITETAQGLELGDLLLEPNKALKARAAGRALGCP